MTIRSIAIANRQPANQVIEIKLTKAERQSQTEGHWGSSDPTHLDRQPLLFDQLALHSRSPCPIDQLLLLSVNSLDTD